ncbi:MAG: formylglycine-generating enzyme family protein [Chlorobium sp.]|nr:MAG: formylglycine-generating enzyme family protein [Chlorobium sp.]
MDEQTPPQSASPSTRVDELDKAFVADLIEQPKQLDKLARLVLIFSFVVPVLYAIGLKFFSSSESAPSGLWFIVAAFASWFVSLLLSLFGLISGKGRQNAGGKEKSVSVEALYQAIIRYKRRMLIGSSIFCFLGVCFAGLTVFSNAFPTMLPNQAPQNFVLIRGGEFTMGSPENEVGHQPNETQHQVKVSDYYMSKYEVTFAEFKRFIAESHYLTDAEKDSKDNGSWILDGNEAKKVAGVNWRHGVSGKERTPAEANHPVVHVSWNDAIAYCQWLSEKTGKWYRLPTEAEWEYACRAGSRTPFNTGENLTTAQANYDGNYPYNNNRKGQYRAKTVAVESFAPNRFGLYNMHGNVWEWCDDVYGEKYYDECKAKGLVENPAGPAPETGSFRVFRGGSWRIIAEPCRSANRGGSTPGHRDGIIGFRLVFVP